jgi:GNAT superfamily N-acetyltransferase
MRLGNLAGRVEHRGIGPVKPGSRTAVSIILGVDAAYRRTGVASQLIRAFVAAAWAKGFDRICTSIFESNVPTRKLYERDGWRLALEARTLRFILERPSGAGERCAGPGAPPAADATVSPPSAHI